MSDYRRSEIVTGLFVTLAAVVFALFAFKVGRFDLMGLLRPEAAEGRAYFLDVKTLQVGSKVKVGGREVGEVTALHLVEGPWPIGDPSAAVTSHRLVNEVTFELTYGKLRLDPETARVTIAQDSLLAPHFLKLDPGRWPAGRPPLPILEAELPEALLVTSEETTGVDELMAVARPAVEELTAILQTVRGELLTPDNLAAAERIIARLDATLEEGHQIASTLNRGILAEDNVEALERMLANLEQASADGSALAARLDRLFDPERDARLDAILTDVAAVSRELRDGLGPISGDLQRVLATADETLLETRNELAELSRRLRETLWQGEMALRKIRANPSLLFFGDDETDLEARDLDLTDVRLRGRARPYEQRDERDEKD